MSTKMKAPEDASSACVGETQYEIVDGHTIVENGEHVPMLERHGFVVVPGEVTHSEPEPEPAAEPEPEPEPAAETPDFEKMTREGIVSWLVANGTEGHVPTEAKPDLVSAAQARLEAIKADE